MDRHGKKKEVNVLFLAAVRVLSSGTKMRKKVVSTTLPVFVCLVCNVVQPVVWFNSSTPTLASDDERLFPVPCSELLLRNDDIMMMLAKQVD